MPGTSESLKTSIWPCLCSSTMITGPSLCDIICGSVSLAAFLSDTKDRGPPGQSQAWRSGEKVPFGQTHYLRAFEKAPPVQTQALRDFEKVSHVGGELLIPARSRPIVSDGLSNYDPWLALMWVFLP